MKTKEPAAVLTGTEPPYITGGKQYNFDIAAYRKYQGSGCAISSKSKYQKEAAMWNDYKYSPEGSLLFNYGVEGTSFKMVNGKPQLTEEITKNSKGFSIDQALGQHAMSADSISFDMAPDVWVQRMSLPEQHEAIERWKEGLPDRILPAISPTAEESTKLSAIMTQVNTYRDEMFHKFIMGQAPLSDFDKYVKAIKDMGIEEAIKIEQAALDRFNARK
jgi:putative aldouronate transport system substrate-binding protein